ncbi:rnc (predicted) [Pycnogonum litorale]
MCLFRNSRMSVISSVSLLQEVCTRDRVTPKYEIISVAGQQHEPTFVYRVTVKGKVATGSGRTKKKAKHSAAQAVLELLNQVVKESRPALPKECIQSNQIAAEAVSPYDEEIPGNPIGLLQQLCAQRGRLLPCYRIVNIDGLAHERFFSVECRVGNLTQIGCGKSKKSAKHHAASKMLEQLDNVRMEVCDIVDDVGDDVADGVRAKPTSKDFNVPAFSPSDTQPISKLHLNLMSSGTTLKMIQLADLRPDNPIQLLEKIGKENGFNIKYVPFEHISKNGKRMFLRNVYFGHIIETEISGDS